MRQQENRIWTEATRAIIERMPSDGDREAMRDAARTIGLRVMTVRNRIGKLPDRMTLRDMGRIAAEVAEDATDGRPPDPSGRLSPVSAVVARALVRGYAVASDWSTAVPRHEIAELGDALSRIGGRTGWDASASVSRMRREIEARADRPVPAEVPSTIPFRFAWRQVGPRGRSPRTVVGIGHAPINPIEAADAPVVARLHAPDGTRIDLRTVDDAFIRPVLSPGSWKPIDAHAFADAALGGVPWRDSPFLPPPTLLGPVQGAGEWWPDEAPVLTATDARSREEALARVLVNCGTLFSTGGVVHRATAAPRLVVALNNMSLTREYEERSGPMLAWAFEGGPRSDVAQATLAPFGNHPLGRAVAPWLDQGVSAHAMSFGLGDGDDAIAFLQALAPALEHWHGKPMHAISVPAEILDPSAFPRGHSAFQGALDDLRGLLDERGDVPLSEGETSRMSYAAAIAGAARPSSERARATKDEDRWARAARMAVEVAAALEDARAATPTDPGEEDLVAFTP